MLILEKVEDILGPLLPLKSHLTLPWDHPAKTKAGIVARREAGPSRHSRVGRHWLLLGPRPQVLLLVGARNIGGSHTDRSLLLLSPGDGRGQSLGPTYSDQGTSPHILLLVASRNIALIESDGTWKSLSDTRFDQWDKLRVERFSLWASFSILQLVGSRNIAFFKSNRTWEGLSNSSFDKWSILSNKGFCLGTSSNILLLV